MIRQWSSMLTGETTMFPKRGLWFALATSVGGWSAAVAHHSPSQYDMSQEVVLEGTIAEVEWQNPHVYLTVEMSGPDGSTIMQVIETAGISDLHAAGVTETSLALGDRVNVRAWPSRRGVGHRVFGLALTTADGGVLPLQPRLRASAPNAAADSIAGTWLADAETFFGILGTFMSGPLTDSARSALGDVEAESAAVANCDPVGLPFAMTVPVVTVFEVGPNAIRIAIDIDDEHTRRVVHLDQTARPPDAPRTPEGYSRGRWEGNVLVVETDGFAPDPEGLFVGVPSSEDKRVVERFRLSNDLQRLLYDATVEDPEFLLEPVGFSTHLRYRPDLSPAGAHCDPATARRFLVEE
jgi:hypothetical protein